MCYFVVQQILRTAKDSNKPIPGLCDFCRAVNNTCPMLDIRELIVVPVPEDFADKIRGVAE
jgi:hypothetical protein